MGPGYNSSMNIYISHAPKDRKLALDLAKRLIQEGYAVSYPYDDFEVEPGENWAMKVAKALDQAEMMIVLLTPRARETENVRRDLSYAFFNERFEGRFLTVLATPKGKGPIKAPGILDRLPKVKLGIRKSWEPVVTRIEELANLVPAG